MQLRLLGKTGLSVSALGFGSAEIGFLKTEYDQASAVMNLLLDSGVNLLDTAAMYPGSEDLIGRAIGHRRDEYIVISKCGWRIPESSLAAWSPELISLSVDRTLQNLRTDRLDVMLLHSCDLDVLRQGSALDALVRARDMGKVRFIGYAGDNQAAAYATALPDVAVIETSVNICDQANIENVLPSAAVNNIGVLAKRAMANAAWKDIGEQRGMFQKYAQTYTERLRKMQLSPRHLGFECPEADSWAELSLRFAISFTSVHSAIVGTTSVGNALRNVEAVSRGPLAEGVVTGIRDAFREADPEGAWLGKT